MVNLSQFPLWAPWQLSLSPATWQSAVYGFWSSLYTTWEAGWAKKTLPSKYSRAVLRWLTAAPGHRSENKGLAVSVLSLPIVASPLPEAEVKLWEFIRPVLFPPLPCHFSLFLLWGARYWGLQHSKTTAYMGKIRKWPYIFWERFRKDLRRYWVYTSG